MKVKKIKWHKSSPVLQLQDGTQDHISHWYLSTVSMNPLISGTTCFAPMKRIVLAFCWSRSLQKPRDTAGRLQNNYLNQRAEENDAQDSKVQKKPAALQMWEVWVKGDSLA